MKDLPLNGVSFSAVERLIIFSGLRVLLEESYQDKDTLQGIKNKLENAFFPDEDR